MTASRTIMYFRDGTGDGLCAIRTVVDRLILAVQAAKLMVGQPQKTGGFFLIVRCLLQGVFHHRDF